MGRSGYYDDYDEDGYLALYRGTVASATRGKRGQAFFKELLQALDDMPVKRLIKEDLVRKDGQVCTLGALGVKKQVPDLDKVDPEDAEYLAQTFNVAHQLIREVEYENDEAWGTLKETPEERWQRMRNWVAKQIKS